MQFGVEDEAEFTTIEFDAPAPSSMSQWPTKENPDVYYKVASTYVTLTMDQNVIERNTYSFLEWLGDIGGLYDALRLIGFFVLLPFFRYQVKAELLAHIFRFTESKHYAERRARLNSFVDEKDEHKIDKFGKLTRSEISDSNRLADNMAWDF